MPCDPQLRNYDDENLLTLLAEIENLIQNYQDIEIIGARGFNYDSGRNNQYTRTMNAFLKK